MDKILRMLEGDARLTSAEIATMLEKEEGDIKKAIREYEKSGAAGLGILKAFAAMKDPDEFSVKVMFINE